MKVSVNISKVTPPFIPQILYRTRLIDLLEKNKDKKLILILGQAAQGKTTLAASYGKTSKIPSAWMNLDKEDSDPFNLFHKIIQSLQYVLQEIDFSHFLPYPLVTMELRPEIPLFRKWTQSIFENISIPIQIVIDGLNRVSSDSPAFKFLQILIEDAPPNIQLIMLSREMPPLSLEFQQLKIRQEALVLTNEELAFTQDEIREFFQKIRRISFSAKQLKKIYLATEGWIGGLILLSETLSRFPEDSRGRYVSEDLPDHFKREVFQYFAEEIFSSQAEQVQDFLIKSSILELIEPGFMKDFIGIENSEEILRGFARRNLFVHSIYDEKKGWLFRYHQLFRDFLKVRFESALQDEERRSLFLKAGYLYEKRGDLENAVKYFLQTKSYPQAGSVIERLGKNLLQKGRRETLSQWLLALPEEIVQGNPWLLFYLTMTRWLSLGKENVFALQKAYTLFKQKGDMKGNLISLGYLIQASIQAGVYVVPIGKLIEEGEALIQSPESNEYPHEKAVLWYFLGLGHIRGEGDIRKGILACQNSHLVSQRLKDISLQAYALNYLALGYCFVGDFSLANETCKKVEKIIEKSVYPELRVITLNVSCVVANRQGDFRRAQILGEKLQSEVEKYGFVSIYPWVYEILVYSRFSLGESAEAGKIAQEYLNAAIALENVFRKGLALRLLALIYLHRGDFKKAWEAADQSLQALTMECRSVYEIHMVKVLMGLICYHLKDYQGAKDQFKEALKYFDEISSYNSLAEIHLAMAILESGQGKSDEAAPHLQTGFKIAEERKYEHFFVLGTKYLTKACLLALELKVAGAMDYAAHLLSTRLSSEAEEGVKKLANHPDSKVKEKAWKIRRTIHRSKVPRLRIETLGGFRVFRGDSLMEEKEWDRNQPKQLLKAIVSNRNQGIPKGVLTEALWPEENPEVAENNFKTTLQRLRKSLEPAIHIEFNSSYVHLRDNFIILDHELCQVDVDLFLSLLKKGEEKEKEGDIKAALSFYAEAMETYKGDFLPEELYAPWVDMKREELKGKYIELLNRMAKLHERQGSSTKAIACHKKAIQADPLLEDSYQSLMTLYSNKGMLNEALRVYEACKKALETWLKAYPDSTTTALYKKILEKLPSA